MLLSALLLSMREIKRNLLRSILTILGIIIGVAAVVTMVTVGRAATRAVSTQISSLGSNVLTLRPGQMMGPSFGGTAPAKFKLDDVSSIESQVVGLGAVAPMVSSSVTLIYGNSNWSSTVTGTTNAYLSASHWAVAQGRAFSDDELAAGKAVCLIGATLQKQLFAHTDPLGEELRIQDFACQVVGILESKGLGGMGRDQDDTILMPLTTVQRRITGTQYVDSVMMAVTDDGASAAATKEVEALMRERRKLANGVANDFSIMDSAQFAQALSGTMATMTGLLGAVAAVSLLVGGIGIMNIMLVSVTERTREIGIRMAIGALEHEVLLQFLIEAVMLSVLGGLIGLLLALIASVGLGALLNLGYAFEPGVNLLAFAVSALIGVVFGFFPARRAAQLNPIEALRHE